MSSVEIAGWGIVVAAVMIGGVAGAALAWVIIIATKGAS